LSRRRRLALITPILLAGLLGMGAGSARAVHPRDMEFEPLHWEPPTPVRVTFPNGLVAYLLEDDEIPLVEVTIFVRTGSVFDPPAKSGLARLAASTMRYGGTGRQSPDEIEKTLELMAADLEIYMRSAYAAVAMSVLRKDVDEGLELLAEILRDPAFDPERMKVYRQERLEDIRRRYDRPARTAAIAFRRLVYGTEGPWARLATAETVNRITRSDLIEFHRHYFRPDNLILTMSGDLTRSEMIEKIEETLGDWAPEMPDAVVFPGVLEVELSFEPSLNHVDAKVSQSYLRIGHLGYRYHDPSEASIEMMNYILGGGGFLSRLVREVRSRRGLAYSIRSAYRPGVERGIFEVECVTDAGNTMEALELIHEIIREMLEAPPSESELEKAKESRINEFVFAFDSKTRIVRQAGWLEFRDYPEDHLETWVDRVRAVTPEDVLRAARSYLHPDGLTVLVVGDGDRFERPLGELGDVRQIEIEKFE